MELHTARVVATGITDKPPVNAVANGAPKAEPEPSGSREIRLGGRATTARSYDGPSLAPGAAISGPALIDDVDTTLLLPDGALLTVDELGNYVFSLGEPR
jgi:N-methylhydantoinase A